jgi:IS5 family transposase
MTRPCGDVREAKLVEKLADIARMKSTPNRTAVPVNQPKGGQFVLHAKALHGNPFDGHTLNGAVADVERNTGVEVRRIHVDKGYRGHDYPNRFRIFISDQVRRTTAAIKCE